MRIAVIGAGIVGVATAYELAKAGHEVVVLERRSGVAEETSFANAGFVAPGYVTPWAAPGMPAKVALGLLKRHSAVKVSASAAWAQRRWIAAWLRACKPGPYTANRKAMQSLAVLSRTRTLELAQGHGWQFEQRQGVLVLLRGPKELERAQAGLAVLAELGAQHHVLDANACRALEPGLNPATRLEAGIHLPSDWTGNCRQFAQLQRQAAQDLGAEFRFGVSALAVEPGSPVYLRFVTSTSQGKALQERFDAAVLCAGPDANALLAPLNLGLPLASVYGYSITANLRHSASGAGNASGPQGALMDERYKVAVTRLGQRVRVAGMARLGAEGRAPDGIAKSSLASLYHVLDDWFPGVIHHQDVQRWKGARPMLPDGPPIVGPTPAQGLWANLGHGSSGWAMACGSAQVLAAQLAGSESPIDASGLSWQRLALARR